MSFNCLACHTPKRIDLIDERGRFGNKQKPNMTFCTASITCSGNYEQIRNEAMSGVSSEKGQHRGINTIHTTYGPEDGYEAKAAPKLVRSSGMRRDWSFEDLIAQKDEGNMRDQEMMIDGNYGTLKSGTIKQQHFLHSPNPGDKGIRPNTCASLHYKEKKLTWNSSSDSKMLIPQTRNIGLPLMNLMRFKGLPILQQLHIEERLLRTSSENWCIVNDGTSDPNIVMGVSGKPAELLDIESVLRDQVPVIRRFTGGGTVIVDHGTVFVTFICNKDAVPDLQPYPRPIMSWSGSLYSKVFQGIGDFHLRENDYVFGNHKFGGNAQSITKNRWVHHTSFLWDFSDQNMAYLKHPKRAPEYRSARGHLDFICRLKDYMPRSTFINKTMEATGTQFSLRSFELEAIETSLETEFRPSTRFLTNEELEAAAVAG